MDIKLADIHKDGMRDPLNPAFFDDVWCRVAENNTKIYRRVFRCMPDSEVTNWAEYKEFKAYSQRFKESMDGPRSSEEDEAKPEAPPPPPKQSGAAPGIAAPSVEGAAKALTDKLTGGAVGKIVDASKAVGSLAHGGLDEKKAGGADAAGHNQARSDDTVIDPEKTEASRMSHLYHESPASPFPTVEEEIRQSTDTNSRLEVKSEGHKERRATFSNSEKPPNSASGASTNGMHLSGVGEVAGNPKPLGSQRRRRRAATRGSRRGLSQTDDMLNRAEAEEVLGLTQGTLVQFPYDWLLVEETNGNWLFQVDQVAPLQI